MKKIIFALLTVVLLASCGEKKAAKTEEAAAPQKYTIVGVDTTQVDSTQVFMYEDRRGKTVLETTTIQSGKFSFAGELEAPLVRFVGIEGVNKAPQVLVLEAGEIKVEGDAVTGTPLNDKMTDFMKRMREKETPDAASILSFVKENSDKCFGTICFGKKFLCI